MAMPLDTPKLVNQKYEMEFFYCYKINLDDPFSEYALRMKEISDLFNTQMALHLLTNLCNVTFGTLFIPAQKFIISQALVMAFSFLVAFYAEFDLLAVLFVGEISMVFPFFLISPALIMSSVFDTSLVFRERMKERISSTENRKEFTYYSKRIRAMRPLRCQVGNLYHMEARAKLTLLDSVIHEIVFILLLIK